MLSRKWLFALPLLVAACGVSSDPTDEAGGAEEEVAALSPAKISAELIAEPSKLPSQPPALGSQRVHLIDVGTGLSILIQGHDFTMLYDGGSNDDSKGVTPSAGSAGNQSRLLAYLFAAVGPSGGPECVPQGDKWKKGETFPEKTIDHLVLSHAHRDHISMLGDVLHCYKVSNVWEPGAVYDQSAYRDFVASVAAEPGVVYHTAAAPPSPLPKTWQGATLPSGFKWTKFAENDQVTLGNQASFKVLHVDPTAPLSEANNSSVVLRMALRNRMLLLMGDAQGGARDVPDASVNSVEKELLARHAKELDADIFQIGHHGSSTSSRKEFLNAVFPAATASATRPRFALLSAGPTPYAGQVLPDRSIVDEIMHGHPGMELHATNTHDRLGGPGHPDRCPAADRVGMDDEAPGGCDNVVLKIAP